MSVTTLKVPRVDLLTTIADNADDYFLPIVPTPVSAQDTQWPS